MAPPSLRLQWYGALPKLYAPTPEHDEQLHQVLDDLEHRDDGHAEPQADLTPDVGQDVRRLQRETLKKKNQADFHDFTHTS